jgi:hypothetical protein
LTEPGDVEKASDKDTECNVNDTMVLDDFVLIDGTGRPAVPERRIVVQGGVIASVEPAVGRASGPK